MSDDPRDMNDDLHEPDDDAEEQDDDLQLTGEALQEKITEVQIKYAEMLMEKAHVVGCGMGLAIVEGEYTDQLALVVMVDVKLPEDELDPEDVVPRYLEGVRCDVQETGAIQAF